MYVYAQRTKIGEDFVLVVRPPPPPPPPRHLGIA